MTTSQEMLKLKAIPRKKMMQLMICLALAVLTVTVFGSVRDCGFINLDDGMYVYENAYVQSSLSINSISNAFSFDSLRKSGNWHPLTWLSLMMDYSLFGLNPLGYHLINLLFHIMNTILLFLVLMRLTKSMWPSAFVAALFAIHPLHVESVAWVSERKDVLSTFFWMLATGAYSYYVEQRNLQRYIPVILFFALGLMSKSMVVTLPFVLLLLDYWPLGRFSELIQDKQAGDLAPVAAVSDGQRKQAGGKKAVKKMKDVKEPVNQKYTRALPYSLVAEKIPLFVLAFVSAVVTYLAQQSGGSLSSTDALPLAIRIGNALVSYAVYMEKTILPVHLAVFYPYPDRMNLWLVFGLLLLLAAITLVIVRRSRRNPYLATGWFWYLGTLVPVIGIVQVGSQAMADRYTYIPLIGLFIMLAWGVPEVLKKWEYRKEILWGVSVLCILCLSVMTWIQVGYWKDSLTLYDHASRVTKGNWLIYNNRGVAHHDLGNYKQAIEDYARAIEIKSRYAEAFNNRGSAYRKLGDYRQAISEFNRAIEIKPDYEEAYNNRGAVFHILGHQRDAIADFNKAIEIRPVYATAYNNRGNAYNALGDYRQAIEDYSRAINIRPKYGDAYYNRGTAFNSLGHYREAIADLSRAIEIRPDYPEAYVNRGFAHKGFGDFRGAIADYSRAIEIKPDYAYAYLNRAATHIHAGDNDQGVRDLKTAAKLGDERARNILKRNQINWQQ